MGKTLAEAIRNTEGLEEDMKEYESILGYESEEKEEETDDSESWKEQLQKTQNGRNYSNAFNTLLIFQNDEKLKGKFAFNLLTYKPEIVGKVPWKRLNDKGEITDIDDSCLRNYLSVSYGIKAKDIIYDALNQIVSHNKYHPVRDYLNRVKNKWDGKPRVDTLLIDFFDAEDTELNRWQTRLTLVGAIKRAFRPGCKFDYVLTLKGKQGVGKSSFFQQLAVKDEWFSDSLDDMRGKEAKEQILGKWIIELGEMAAVGKGDQKRIKQFITSQFDEFRQAYGRRSNSYPRQCIFVATTNDELPLKDETGGRRWWIIEVKSKWFEKDIPLEVDQIWAEAMHIYEQMEREGKPLKLPERLEKEARRIQSDNTDKGLYASEIEYILQRGYIERRDYDGKITKIPIKQTCAKHVWVEVLGKHEDDLNSARAREINAVLQSLEGWERLDKRIQFGKYGKQTVYQRKDR